MRNPAKLRYDWSQVQRFDVTDVKPSRTHLTWRVFQTVGSVTSVLNPLSSVKMLIQSGGESQEFGDCLCASGLCPCRGRWSRWETSMKTHCRNFRPDITLTWATSSRSTASLQPRHLHSPLTPTHALLTFISCSSRQLNFYWTQNIPLSELTFWFTSIGKIPDILALFQTGLLQLLLQHPNPNGVTELKRNYRSVIATQILLLTWRE